MIETSRRTRCRRMGDLDTPTTVAWQLRNETNQQRMNKKKMKQKETAHTKRTRDEFSTLLRKRGGVSISKANRSGKDFSQEMSIKVYETKEDEKKRRLDDGSYHICHSPDTPAIP